MNSSKFDSVIFDVDGTLWDTTPIVADAWNAALKDSGFTDVTITADTLKGLFGLPMEVIIDNIIPNATKKQQEDFLPLCYQYEFDYINKTPGILYPELERMLSTLSAKVPLFIVSNCQSGYIELFMKLTGFGKYITDHMCPGDSGLLKADNIKLIAKNNNLSNPVYVGDTQMDANACKEANVPIIHASYGFGTIDEPYATITAPCELIDLI